jgi:hypothetical protein
VTSEPVGSFDAPLQATSPPQDSTRLFVVEQDGVVRVMVNGLTQGPPFLDISGVVRSPADGPGDEQGLLALAFAPDYDTSGLFYVYFTNNNGDVELDEFRRSSGEPNVADAASRRTVLTIPHPFHANHNGGTLVFDASGNLYISTGDGGGNGDNAQSLGSLLGKILRIRPRQSGADDYTVPDNPFQGLPGARREIWAYGLRNPYRFSLDRQTGDLAIGDVGEASFEEVDFVPRSDGTGAGRNFGWNACEGRSAYPVPPEPAPCALPGVTTPVHVIARSAGVCSVIGGYVVRDPSLEELNGRYLYGDLCRPALRQLSLAYPDAIGDATVGSPAVQYSTLVSFGEDACGRIYTAELGGAVERLTDGSSSCTEPLGLPPATEEEQRPPPTPRQPVTPEVPGPSPDLRAPGLGVRVVGGARSLRRRSVRVRIRCDEPCRLRVVSRLSIGRRKLRLREARGLAAPGTVKVLRLRLSRRGRRALRRALARRRRVRLRVIVRARDGADNLSRRSVLSR